MKGSDEVAIYRNIQLSFWTDNKVEDEFTPEDKYFYLYLMTNPQTNICGCYEVSYSQMTNQTGYNKDTIDRLLARFQDVHKIIKWSKSNKEILLLNWYKYNWSKSPDVIKGVSKVAEHIKTKEFKKYVLNTLKKVQNKTVSGQSIDTIETSVSDSVSVNNNINNKLLEDFNIIYKSYPVKKGKTKGFEYYKAWVTVGRVISGVRHKLTNKQIWSAIAKYKNEMEEQETELQYYKHFDTFMCKAILDYVEDEECHT